MNWLEWLLRSNSTGARILRTLIQGVLGVLVAELPELVGLFQIPDWAQALIVALVMAILSPIMAEFGKTVEVMGQKKRLQAARMVMSQEEQEEVLARGYKK